MVIRCDYCGEEKDNKRKYKTNFCDGCLQDKEVGAPAPVDKVFIKNYGMVSKKRLCELERRVMLPYEKPGGGYYVGRRMENGKVSENKQPDYRP